MLVSQIIVTLAEFVHISWFSLSFFNIVIFRILTGERRVDKKELVLQVVAYHIYFVLYFWKAYAK